MEKLLKKRLPEEIFISPPNLCVSEVIGQGNDQMEPSNYICITYQLEKTNNTPPHEAVFIFPKTCYFVLTLVMHEYHTQLHIRTNTTSNNTPCMDTG